MSSDSTRQCRPRIPQLYGVVQSVQGGVVVTKSDSPDESQDSEVGRRGKGARRRLGSVSGGPNRWVGGRSPWVYGGCEAGRRAPAAFARSQGGGTHKA